MVGYNSNESDGMFLDTFPSRCPSGQKATAATFKITVRKLSPGASNDALAFWDGPTPTQVFNTYLWSPNEPVGAVKTLTYNVANLPTVGATLVNGQPTGCGHRQSAWHPAQWSGIAGRPATSASRCRTTRR